jgi:pimeloyl-ACP methyl ester carboxylesterase
MRPVLVPDLPGHGSSDAAGSSGPGVVGAAAAILQTLAALGINQVHLAGEGAGACVALEVTRSIRSASRRMALIDVPWLDEELRSQYLREGLPPTDPVWHGGHLLLAWHLLRDGRLFFPWFRRNHAGALAHAPDLDPGRLQLELRELLIASGAWQNLMRDALRYPLRGAIRAAGAGLALAAAESSPWAPATRDAAAATGARFVSLPAQPSLWIPAIVAPP